ncbi:MAG TPA: hypothetical protein VMF08_03055 [Candidatus Sulfotelmatobacter sp.]|nr:hypothetical protein [Candidatus Sulfotelmatobacter sp.]
MFGKQITELQTRKQALLLESDLNRLRLRAEFNNLREGANFLKRLRRFGSWTSMLGPVAAVIITIVLKRSFPGAGLLRKALAGAPELIRLWRSLSMLLAELKFQRR